MTSRRVLVTGGVCALIGAAVLIACLSGPKEPEYQGKNLSEWGYEYRLECVRRGLPLLNADAPAAAGIRAIGTNAVPWGLKWLKHRTPKWKAMILRINWPNHVRTAVWYTVFGKEERAANAIPVFMALGADGGSAIPDLVAMIADPAEPNWTGAVVALENIGPDGFSAMRAAAKSVPGERAVMLRRIARNYSETSTNLNGVMPLRQAGTNLIKEHHTGIKK